MPSDLNSSSLGTFWSRNYHFLATVIALYISRSQTSRGTMVNQTNGRTPRDLPINMARSGQAGQGNPTPPDSAISMSDNENRFGTAMDDAINRANRTSVMAGHGGVSISLTPQQLTQMGAELANARAEGRFPMTTAASYDIDAIAQDYSRLVALNEARGNAPREEWNRMPNVVQLLVRITQEIRARDKITAERTEEERVQAHVSSMMTGVGAEAKLYSIVQHAVTYAINKGSADRDAVVAGQNMVNILNGIRGTVKDMASQHTHGVHGVNIEAVVEEVFGTIDFALSTFADPLDKNVKQMDGQINQLGGITEVSQGQVHAIGQHVSAIDNHVHSLGNNLNAMGTLLNSTNGNVVALNAQIGLLQAIVNMLPQMIQQSLQERLPVALEAATTPIREAFEAQLGVTLASPPISPTSTIFTNASQDSMLLAKQKSKKSPLKKLLKLFKKSGHEGSF
ncbi:hypothetical protein F5Y13DRAFT_200716 [Hypoxylon sp. FL1857]|nr:hypothetical protein F5Y13DRAFT_200716 [Hypoxylon sp. FL1857]